MQPDDYGECWALLVPPRPEPKTPIEGVPPEHRVPAHYLEIGTYPRFELGVYLYDRGWEVSDISLDRDILQDATLVTIRLTDGQQVTVDVPQGVDGFMAVSEALAEATNQVIRETDSYGRIWTWSLDIGWRPEVNVG